MPQTENIADNKEKKKKDTNPLGISPVVYGLGASAKDAAIAIAGITVGLSAILLGVFREGGKGWRNRDPIVKWLEDREKGIKKVFSDISGKAEKDVLKGAGPIVAISFVTALFLSHFVQLPGIERGRRKAKQAIDKYNLLLDQNAELETKLAGYESKTATPAQAPAGTATVPDQNAPVASKSFASARVPPLDSHVGTLQQQEKDTSMTAAGTRTM